MKNHIGAPLPPPLPPPLISKWNPANLPPTSSLFDLCAFYDAASIFYAALRRGISLQPYSYLSNENSYLSHSWVLKSRDILSVILWCYIYSPSSRQPHIIIDLDEPKKPPLFSLFFFSYVSTFWLSLFASLFFFRKNEKLSVKPQGSADFVCLWEGGGRVTMLRFI